MTWNHKTVDAITYPAGGVIMEARLYTFNELRDLLSMVEQMHANIEKEMRDSK